MFFQASPKPARRTSTSTAIEALNAPLFTGAQIAAALEVLAMLPEAHRDNPHAQAAVLQAYARDAGLRDETISAVALHARVTALAKWTAAHDPQRQSDPEAVLEAAARHSLSESGSGVAFEPTGFQELILFIEELPW
ncbi:hypothetical protein IAG41_00150 [Sphingomonas sp. JC676]|uniref:hypothetical protein n=1 Tax=Sphingomonas sp. JC676 TaxID=2768065 RepID=UPI001657A453|nr:hypothetical protein [Sphingomonas sp. JC676]MBC9030792.1 hypothetical protein [Sphingomonas sp. JC676]